MEKNTQNTKRSMSTMRQLAAAIFGLALLAVSAVPGRAADVNTPPADPANRVAKAWAFDDPQNAWSASGGTTAKPADGCLKLHNSG